MIFAGAYALTATLVAFDESMAADFYEKLRALPSIGGLELPLHAVEKMDDPWRHLDFLPRDLDYILTPLPYVMQSLEKQPTFGLASPDEAGRREALRLADLVHERKQRLEDHCGRASVRAVEWHSAPQRLSNADALRRSLDSITRQNWGSTELWLEHCDAMIPGQIPAKGFLDLQSELKILREFRMGLNINWGRSALEARHPQGALTHIQEAVAAGVLRGLFFSSVTVEDPVYGTWQDNHAPMQISGDRSWMPHSSLLTPAALVAALQAAQPAQALIGVKIQPAPASLSIAARLDCLQQHLQRVGDLAKALPIKA